MGIIRNAGKATMWVHKNTKDSFVGRGIGHLGKMGKKVGNFIMEDIRDIGNGIKNVGSAINSFDDKYLSGTGKKLAVEGGKILANNLAQKYLPEEIYENVSSNVIKPYAKHLQGKIDRHINNFNSVAALRKSKSIKTRLGTNLGDNYYATIYGNEGGNIIRI